ncbi:MarR family winged helix-turn-helix transcriptional regulator [Palleronia pelagia]|uniref:DNA-binding transcriptional regulator, MarR family n=1 Tax=Palleronia pelagia TaxID=387096 RepID=A0A1H8B6C1_9RHOB|nr:MarR family transcriptional regulator [Palleronia pelagia]SEM77849.1 DNA-binding transcriptional regulator, MarR family [Palleronia pelagia]
MIENVPEHYLTPEDMLCFDVQAAHQAFGRVYKPLLAPLGLTYPQYVVMSVLWDAAPLAVGGIGRRTGMETSTLTPLLKRLEAQGLVTRTRAREDERRVEIALTDAGQGMAARTAHVPECVGRATGMSEAEIADLRATLGQLRRTLDAQADATSSRFAG